MPQAGAVCAALALPLLLVASAPGAPASSTGHHPHINRAAIELHVALRQEVRAKEKALDGDRQGMNGFLRNARTALRQAEGQLLSATMGGEIDAAQGATAVGYAEHAFEIDLGPAGQPLSRYAEVALETADERKQSDLALIAKAEKHPFNDIGCELDTTFGGMGTSVEIFGCSVPIKREIVAFLRKEIPRAAAVVENGQPSGSAKCGKAKHVAGKVWDVLCVPAKPIPPGPTNGLVMTVGPAVPIGATVWASVYAPGGKWDFEKFKVRVCASQIFPLGGQTIFFDYACQQPVTEIDLTFPTPESGTWSVSDGTTTVGSGACSGAGTTTISCLLSPPAFEGTRRVASITVTPACASGTKVKSTYIRTPVSLEPFSAVYVCP